MLNLVTRRLAESYADEFETSLAQSETSLPEGSEIYLEIDTEEDTCRYYVANHRHCSIGWLSSVQTHEELGLPEVHSETHLGTPALPQLLLHGV